MESDFRRWMRLVEGETPNEQPTREQLAITQPRIDLSDWDNPDNRGHWASIIIDPIVIAAGFAPAGQGAFEFGWVVEQGDDILAALRQRHGGSGLFVKIDTCIRQLISKFLHEKSPQRLFLSAGGNGRAEWYHKTYNTIPADGYRFISHNSGQQIEWIRRPIDPSPPIGGMVKTTYCQRPRRPVV